MKDGQWCSHFTDHPHACGEHTGLSTGYAGNSGILPKLKGPIILFNSLFSYQPKAAKVRVTNAASLSPVLNLKSLTVWLARQDEQTHPLRVSFHIIQHFIAGATVNCTDKNVWFRFNKPSLEHSPDCGWRIVSDEDGHQRAEGGLDPACNGVAPVVSNSAARSGSGGHFLDGQF